MPFCRNNELYDVWNCGDAGLRTNRSQRYDGTAESDHGENGPGQTKWNKMISDAFTNARVPAQSSPDGKAYKVPLLDVLKQNGITP